MKAVKPPPEINGAKDLEPVEPEEVEGIIGTADQAVVELEIIQSRGGDISVSTPLTETADHRGEK